MIEQQRKAEYDAASEKAAALDNVGWAAGAGATIWARAVQDVLEQHETVRGRVDDLEKFERVHWTAYVLVIAIDQVRTFAVRVAKLTGDAKLAKARARFDSRAPDTEALRDLVTHMDSYAIGKGWRQTGQKMPPISDKYPATFIGWPNGGGTVVDLADKRLDLRAAGNAAIDLAQVAEQVRAEYKERADREMNEAFQRWREQAPS